MLIDGELIDLLMSYLVPCLLVCLHLIRFYVPKVSITSITPCASTPAFSHDSLQQKRIARKWSLPQFDKRTLRCWGSVRLLWVSRVLDTGALIIRMGLLRYTFVQLGRDDKGSYSYWCSLVFFWITMGTSFETFREPFHNPCKHI